MTFPGDKSRMVPLPFKDLIWPVLQSVTLFSVSYYQYFDYYCPVFLKSLNSYLCEVSSDHCNAQQMFSACPYTLAAPKDINNL